MIQTRQPARVRTGESKVHDMRVHVPNYVPRNHEEWLARQAHTAEVSKTPAARWHASTLERKRRGLAPVTLPKVSL